MHEELEGNELALLDAYRMESAPSGAAQARLWVSLQEELELGSVDDAERARDAANEEPAADAADLPDPRQNQRRFGRVSPLTIALGMAAGALLTLSLKGELAETAQQVGTLPQALMQGGDEDVDHGRVEFHADGPATQTQRSENGHNPEPTGPERPEGFEEEEDHEAAQESATGQTPTEAATRTRERVVTRDRVWVPRKGGAEAAEAGSEPRDSRGSTAGGGGGGRGSGGKGAKDGGNRNSDDEKAHDEEDGEEDEDEDDLSPIAELCHDEREACVDGEQPEDECEFEFDYCWLELVCPAEFDDCLHEIGDEDDDACFEQLEDCEHEHEPWHQYECASEFEECLEEADDDESEDECYFQFDDCQEELGGQELPDEDETDFEEG